jgi:hypothetical protein
MQKKQCAETEQVLATRWRVMTRRTGYAGLHVCVSGGGEAGVCMVG